MERDIPENPTGDVKLTKAELVETLATATDLNRREIHEFIDALWEEIKAELLSRKTIELRGFGTFEIKHRKGKARARNPRTGEIVSVADHGSPHSGRARK
jgi:integration host factor subunit beta